MSFCLVACLLLLACTDVYDISYDYSESAPIAEIRSFDWLPFSKKNARRVDDLTLDRVRAAIVGELAQKGVTGPAENPDVLIDITFGSKRGSRGRGSRSRYNYREGYLHIEMVDPDSDDLVWIGSGRAVISPESTPEDSKKIISEVTTRIFKNYPPPGTEN